MAALYGFGAGAAQTIEEVLARRLAWEKFRAAQEAENRRLAMEEGREGREQQLFDVRLPAEKVAADVAMQTGPQKIQQAKLTTTGLGYDTEEKGIDLGEKRKKIAVKPEWAYGMEAVPQPAQPFMPMGEGKSPDTVNFEQQKELGDRSAAAQRSVANIYASTKSQGLTDPQELAAIDRLNRQYLANPSVKSALEMRRQLSLMRGSIQRMVSGQSRDLNADSQAVLVTFQKILDPTSVVRESEYARSAQGQAMMDRLYGSVTKLAKGGQGVPLESLKNFLAAAEQMYRDLDSFRATEAARIGAIADAYGLPKELILSEVPNVGPTETTPTGYANPQNVVPVRE